MPELLNSFPHFPKEERARNEHVTRRKLKDYLAREEHCISSNSYRLVYQRANKKYEFQDDLPCTIALTQKIRPLWPAWLTIRQRTTRW